MEGTIQSLVVMEVELRKGIVKALDDLKEMA